MAYTVVRAAISGGLRTKFKEVEDDSDFDARSYADLDNYLSTMEERGWTIVDTEVDPSAIYMYITMHRQET